MEPTALARTLAKSLVNLRARHFDASGSDEYDEVYVHLFADAGAVRRFGIALVEEEAYRSCEENPSFVMRSRSIRRSCPHRKALTTHRKAVIGVVASELPRGRLQRPGALALLGHEYGHLLLDRWGRPTADHHLLDEFRATEAAAQLGLGPQTGLYLRWRFRHRDSPPKDYHPRTNGVILDTLRVLGAEVAGLSSGAPRSAGPARVAYRRLVRSWTSSPNLRDSLEQASLPEAYTVRDKPA